MYFVSIAFIVCVLIVGSSGNNNTTPLYLTDYIMKGDISKAVELSRVNPFLGNITSYSGFLTVNGTSKSHMFFWFLEKESGPEDGDTVIWLDGWSTSSLFGVFLENGPYIYQKNRLQLRECSWHKLCNMLYIDNPVGVGFSHAVLQEGYARNDSEIGNYLYLALVQFFVMFPQYQSNNLYIAGHAYTGKYSASFAREIHNHNAVSRKPINLKGLFLGNPYIDPSYQINLGTYIFGLGLLDYEDLAYFLDEEIRIKTLKEERKYDEAFKAYNQLIFDPIDSFFLQRTGLNSYRNYLNDSRIPDDWVDFVKSKIFRNALHLGNTPFENGSLAMALLKDKVEGVKELYEQLLDENIKVTIYVGQQDILFAYPMLNDLAMNLNWSQSEEFTSANRYKLYLNKSLLGYVKTGGSLTEVLIRNAGQIVPYDKPDAIFYLLYLYLSDSL